MNPNRENPPIKQTFLKQPSKEKLEKENKMTLQELEIRIKEIVRDLEKRGEFMDSTEHGTLIIELERLNLRKDTLGKV